MGNPDELTLARRVLDELHPGAPWRREPLGVSVRLSALAEAVGASLAEHPFYPPDLRPEDLGDGAIIEKRGRWLHVVHVRFEIGQMRFSEVSSHARLSLRGAVRRYLRHYRHLLRVRGISVRRWA